jgi:hypothetical protein
MAIGLCAMLISGVAVRADNFPPRKAGLWQVDMTISGTQMPPQQMKMCIDPATDAEMYRLGINASQGMCEKPEIRRSGSTVTVSTVCNMGGSKVFTQAVTKFTGDTAYHTDASTRFDPPMAGRDQSSMAQDARWTGPCPADMVPGDVVMGNGAKINIKQVLGGQD